MEIDPQTTSVPSPETNETSTLQEPVVPLSQTAPTMETELSSHVSKPSLPQQRYQPVDKSKNLNPSTSTASQSTLPNTIIPTPSQLTVNSPSLSATLPPSSTNSHPIPPPKKAPLYP
ncbi:hypothetical protein IGI04_036643 [Brassica rapa subsp. trilocularis]|uniref:Uncharacterized protein n=1 Tax=Brassica rapa subsp. trilocularis TaxID=1813537 RepID=A0ABQ7LF11_BRACM|nr:hypothetical protein IGI04_036643 [Brassica rapa subsp. trilocularis]